MKKTTLFLICILALSGVSLACSFGRKSTPPKPTAVPINRATSTLIKQQTLTAAPQKTASSTPTDTPTTPAKIFKSVKIQPEQGALLDVLNTECQKAVQQGLHPFVEFYADWCPSCQDVIHFMDDPLMVDAFSGTYIIHINVDEWQNQIRESGFDVTEIPAWAELDKDGQPTGYNITGAAWGKNIPENMAPPLKAYFNHP